MNKILIVEDSKDIRENLMMMLNLNNFEVLTAENGKDGYQLAVSENPDLIIADIMMPKMSGINLLKTLKQNNPNFHTPFIYLTAKSSLEDVRTGMNLGADDYITKPYKTEDVLNSVKSRLKKKEIYDKKFKELYSNISHYIPHELRTPLVSIIGFTNLVHENLDNIDKDEVKDMMNVIRQSSKRLHHTIEKFLVYSECEYLSKNKEQYPNKLTESSMISAAEIEFIFNEKLQMLEMDNKAELEIDEIIISFKEEYFKIIVSELIENAIKFSDSSSPIKIKTVIEGNYVTFSIINYGRGMTREELNCIAAFSQFNRDKYEQSGNGLGLAIIKLLADIYNCTFIIKSEPGAQTEVKFSFPLNKKA